MIKADNEEFVVFDNVSKKYDGFLALEDISFKINRGENFGYIGPNGAGKTTTIKILVGLITEFDGTVTIGNYSMLGDKQKVHEMIGYLPQRVSFQEWRSVEHTLRSFGKLSGMKEEKIDRRVGKVFEQVGLEDIRRRKVGELSGGTIQKLGLAQALLHDPKLLVLDEPLSGLDPASRYEVKEIIKELSRGGTTVFFSSHILSDVQDVASKIGILDIGEIMQVGTLNDLKAKLTETGQIEVQLSQSSERWKELESIEGVEDIENPTPERLLINLETGVDLDKVSHKLVKNLLDLDCKIRSFTPVAPKLDEVYLDYVGGRRK